MRGTVGTLTAIMLLSLMTPFASSQEVAPQTENVFHTYSGAVQRAFFQVEAVENSILEDPPEQWLVLTTLTPEIIQPWINENVEIKIAPGMVADLYTSLETEKKQPVKRKLHDNYVRS